MALAAHVAKKSAAVLALGKRAVADQANLPLREAYTCASAAMVENLLLEDGREGLAAFAEKRPANWQDR
jgi:enoyl-CoA hydratase/carnithine racemase